MSLPGGGRGSDFSLAPGGVSLPYAGPDGSPLPRAQARAAAAQALSAIDELVARNEKQRKGREHVTGYKQTRELSEPLLWDNSLKEPLRFLIFEGPFPVVARCGHRCVYAALDPFPEHHGGVILTAPYILAKKQRRGGAHDLLSADKTKVVLGTRNMVEDASHGRGFVIPTGGGSWGTPFGRRRVIQCRKCGAQERVINIRLVALFLGVIVDGDNEIRLG